MVHSKKYQNISNGRVYYLIGFMKNKIVLEDESRDVELIITVKKGVCPKMFFAKNFREV